MQLGADDFAALGGFDQFGAHAVGDFREQNRLNLIQQIRRIAASRKTRDGVADARFGQRVVGKLREERLTSRHEAVKIAALAA